MAVDRVPIDKDGNWLSYDAWNDGGYDTNVTFEAHMEITGMYTGRSAKGLKVTDLNTGRDYHMFVSDFIKTVPLVTIVMGCYPKMTWTVSKRGSNYGIKPVVK
jgi:hypothetical protein